MEVLAIIAAGIILYFFYRYCCWEDSVNRIRIVDYEEMNDIRLMTLEEAAIVANLMRRK